MHHAMHVMSFTQARKHKYNKLYHSNLDFVNHSKYLGVTIQTSKPYTLALIRRNLKLAPDKVKERAYTFTWLDHKLNMSHRYGIPGLNRTLQPLEKIQRHTYACHYICNYSYITAYRYSYVPNHTITWNCTPDLKNRYL